MAPYENWVSFSSEAFRLWAIFTQLTNPSSIERLGVRFINQIKLPAGDLAFGDFAFISAPPFQLETKWPFVKYVQQETLVIPDAQGANITRAVLPPEQDSERRLSIILDIDVFNTGSISLETDEISAHLEKLRLLKNKIFFGSITEKALEFLR